MRNPKLATETLESLDISWNAKAAKPASAKSVHLLGELMSKSGSLEFFKFSGLGLDHRALRKLLSAAIGNQKFSDEFISSRALLTSEAPPGGAAANTRRP